MTMGTPKLRRVALALALLQLTGACGLQQREDFLLGRPCAPERDDCGEGARCLPHEVDAEIPRYEAYFCRDEASFDPNLGVDLPRAFCDPERGIDCPGRSECVPDRFREDVGARPRVCRAP